jgi:outer membrane protein insertion porin family
VAIVRQTLLGVLATFLLAAPAVRAAEVVVKEVRIEGNRRTDPAAIRAAIAAKAGQPLDLDQVDADIRAIMKIGSFSDVVVDEEGPPSNPTLIYRVVERPTVREVKTVGNKELKKDDLKDTVALKPNTFYDPSLAAKDVEKIQKKYVEKGYFLTDVVVNVAEAPDNQVDVTYQVNEHAKVQVREIRFVGNDHVPKEDIAPFLQTKEGGLLPFLGGTFREDAFEADLQSVQAVYLERGFVDVKVQRASVQLSPDRQYLFITIPVIEGVQYDLGEVGFSGELLGQEAGLNRVTRVRTGDRFVRTRVVADLTAIQDLYRDMGYAYVNVEPRTHPHPDTRRVDIDFNVQPGDKVRIGRIQIVGNDKTRDKVIRRELRLYEGQLFSGSGYRVSKNRIQALGYFETVDLAQTKVSPDTMDVLVTVKERATGTFQLGAGFSSYENFVLTGQISQQNFLGWGQTLSLQVQWSSVRQLGEISFVEPYFFDTRWTFSFDLYANEANYSTFTRRAVGGSMTWGYELAGLSPWFPVASKLEDVRLFATYTHEVVDVGTSSVVPIARATGTGSTSSLRLSLQADKRDNRLTPTSGWFGSFSFETAPPFLSPKWLFGSKANLFNRYTLDLRGYHPLYKGIIGRARLQMGWLQSLSAEGVPLSELYYVGGINSIRGYRFQSIAPRMLQACTNSPFSEVCRTNGEGYQEVILNLESEFPLFEKAGIRGVVFFDAGNSFPAGTYHDPTVPYNFYKSVGLGVRWFSPLGPLRFEWGIPLNRRKDNVGNFIDEPFDFQFTIGNFF